MKIRNLVKVAVACWIAILTIALTACGGETQIVTIEREVPVEVPKLKEVTVEVVKEVPVEVVKEVPVEVVKEVPKSLRKFRSKR